MIIGLDHINIVVKELEAAKTFFRLLGFQEGDSSELKGEWISSVVGLENVNAVYQAMHLPGSSVQVELIEYRNPPADSEPGISKANRLGYRHLAFSVDNLEQTMQDLRKHNIRFLSEMQVYEKRGKKLVYFYGPDGILLELSEYPR
jgi:catechol 2,3-dioxygenase-like lactoylglutathione lyase family enzyme